MKKLMITSLFLVAMFALTGCSDDDNPVAISGNNNDEPVDPMTIVDVALGINEDSGEFSTLIAAVLAADLAGALSGDDMLTVFAPTDAAFAKLDLNADNIGEMDKSALSGILLYHVAAGKLMAEDVVGKETITMLNTGMTRISLRDGAPYINDSMIVATDVPADNGVIHVIDTVLLP
jgi:transforming growth factor-beta-induced protein